MTTDDLTVRVCVRVAAAAAAARLLTEAAAAAAVTTLREGGEATLGGKAAIGLLLCALKLFSCGRKKEKKPLSQSVSQSDYSSCFVVRPYVRTFDYYYYYSGCFTAQTWQTSSQTGKLL